MASRFTRWLNHGLFRYRHLALLFFLLGTAMMTWLALGTRVDTGFTKRLPLQHEYIQTFIKYQDQFSGANRVLIALRVEEEEDIYSEAFLDLLKKVTDEMFFLPGVERSSVTSLWTPNTRFIEIVEEGFSGGNVIPADFDGSPAALEVVRRNVEKSGKIGLLVSRDLRGALVSGTLQEINPETGEKLDYIQVAARLEAIRERFEEEGESIGLSIHIIGFAKIMGDIAEGVTHVLFFFVITLIITSLLVWIYTLSRSLTACLVLNGIVGVIWQLGLLRVAGYGIDPMSILVPFLIFAISVSHGVQMIRAFRSAYLGGKSGIESASTCFQQLLAPGLTALVTDTVGFLSILLIKIEIIQELAIAATLGVAALILTNVFLLPILLSYVTLSESLQDQTERRRKANDKLWNALSQLARPRISIIIIVGSVGLFLLAQPLARNVQIGDQDSGVPELRKNARYNKDTRVISENFSIGVDVVTVIVESTPDAVVDHQTMTLVDRFAWHMENVQGVQGVQSLPGVAKTINAGWNEGSLKWHVLPRHPATLAQSVSPVDTSTGLLNPDGSVIPVYIYLEDHKAQTIQRVIQEVKTFRSQYQADSVQFKLATGNIGVMGATNEVVQAAQFPILLYVFGAVIGLCLLVFRSLPAAVCIVLPLGLVSVLAYALMAILGIGLKVSTLPVVALGVGVGVDYGIYLYSRLRYFLRQEQEFQKALFDTFHFTGSAVVFTGLTLALGVSTWIFSPLKFQADMGILLTFMFLFNMAGAMILMPALARWMIR